MKRFLLAFCAASIVAGGAGIAQADPQYDHNRPDVHDNRGNYDNHDNRDNRGGNDWNNRGGNDWNNHGNNANNNWRNDWRVGHRMDNDDWRQGQRVDWHRRHLRAPPRGYEWREVNGRYVLAAVTTGLILSIITGR